MNPGAYRTGQYPNFLLETGMGEDDTRNLVSRAFHTIFFDPGENFCHRAEEDAWCIVDTGNNDVRTEGMSYGMMMCVQMDRKDIFDRLWTFADRYMRQRDGIYSGYFAWSVRTDGKHNAEGPAPDGEEYFAMALMMASARWGDGEGLYNYGQQARDILRHAVHQSEIVPGGQPMWEPGNALIRFVPEMKISDPSYHLPHFYELFALKAEPEDRAFWKRAAAASRAYIAASAHPETGLSPEYADYDGKTVLLFGKPWAYYSDAYRVAENIALDRIWFGPHPDEDVIATRIQDFFAKQDTADLLQDHKDEQRGVQHGLKDPARRECRVFAASGRDPSHRLRADAQIRKRYQTTRRKNLIKKRRKLRQTHSRYENFALSSRIP